MDPGGRFDGPDFSPLDLGDGVDETGNRGGGADQAVLGCVVLESGSKRGIVCHSDPRGILRDVSGGKGLEEIAGLVAIDDDTCAAQLGFWIGRGDRGKGEAGHRHGVDAMVGRVDNVWDRPCHDTIGDLDVCGELDAGQVSEGELPGRGGARRPRYGDSGDVVGAVDPDLCQRGADTPGHACLADDVVDHLREVTTDSHCYGAVGQADGVLRDLRGLGASMTSDFLRSARWYASLWRGCHSGCWGSVRWRWPSRRQPR